MSLSGQKEIFQVESVYGAFYSGGDIEWTSDGSKLLCLCDGKIKVFDVNTGKVLPFCNQEEAKDDEDEDIVLTFCLSKDNTTVVSAHKSGLFKCWKWQEEEPVPQMWKGLHRGPVARTALTGDGAVLVSGGSDSSVRVWDLHHHACLRNLKGLQGVVSVLQVLEGKEGRRTLVFAAGDDTVIRSWDLVSGELKREYSGHFSKVTALTFDEDHKHLISCGRDKVVILWDLEAGGQLRTIPTYECLEAMVVVPTAPSTTAPRPQHDSILVAVAGEKGIVTIWDLAHNCLVFQQSNSMVKAAEGGGVAVTGLLYCEHLKTLAVVSVDHNVILHHAVTFAVTRQLVGFSDEILDIVYLGETDSRLAVATNSCDIKVYKTSDMSCQLLQGHQDIVVTLATSPANRNILVSGSKDKSVRVWLVTDKEAVCVCLAMRHTAAVSAVALPITKCNFLVSAAHDNTIKMWHLPTKLKPDKSESLNVHLTTLAHEKDINAICVSPNDKFIATGSLDKTAKVWSCEDLSLVGVLTGHRRGVWNVSFSPVDQVLLTSSSDCTLKLWALSDLSCIKTLEGHESSVMAGRFVTRGLQVVSVGADGLLKLWSIKTSECVKSFEHHDAKIWALVVSSDETRLVTGGADSQLVVWRDVTEESAARAAAERQERALQDQELANLLHDEDLLPALRLALTLERPATALKIIETVLKQDRDGLLDTVRQLREDQKRTLLKLATEWNSISKHCYAAQMVISCLMDDISDGSLRLEKSSLEQILPYTERHFKRMTQLMQDLHLLQYTAALMKPHS
ncbi:transducin beta-like protein 3 [Macrosteles quadrilineatus]|uniref:transducin beta-like protein 3 n=1 Tax=Macrosteles quadrilineatus TaxID=74068 RepID=UPI0023E25735|nr:transducin beta-like protein 3 [Macrosteles quadrilineatus]